MTAAAGIILLLIALTAFYVSAEYGAVGVRRSRLRRLCEDGNPTAARLLPVVEDPLRLNRYIASSQVGITISGLVLGAYAQGVLAPRFAPLLRQWTPLDARSAYSVSSTSILIVLTMLSVVFGEIVPKTVALRYPTEVALATARPMRWSGRVLAWFIEIIDGSATLLRSLMRMPAATHRHIHSPEEIALLIAESRDGGLLEPQEQVRLHRALRLGLRNARQLMVPRERLAAIDLATPLADVLRLAATSPYSRLPVFRQSMDDVVGILHTKDVVVHFIQRGRTETLASLVRPILRVPDAMPADRLLEFLRQRRSHQALVVDSGAAVVGLITLEDVLGELLGTVPDEFKTQRLLPLRLSDGRVRLPGDLPLERARLWVEGAWPADGATVGDFIVREAGRVPETSDQFDVWELPVEIESVENGRVSSVIVTPPRGYEDGEGKREGYEDDEGYEGDKAGGDDDGHEGTSR
jgi:CBS domain containing-hemolysin-like protein